MMQRIAYAYFMFLLVSSSFSAHLKDGNSGSTYDFSDTSALGLHKSQQYLGGDFMEAISMKRQPCKWVTLFGDPYITCEIPFGTTTPKNLDLRAEGAIILTCGENIMGQTLTTLEQSRDHTMLRWSGASFDWGSIMVTNIGVDDASVNPNSRRCRKDLFNAWAVVYESNAILRIKGRSSEFKASWLRNRRKDGRDVSAQDDPNTQAILRAKGKQVARACYNSSETYCKHRMEELENLKAESEAERGGLLTKVRAYMREEFKRIDKERAIECQKTPNSKFCQERAKKLEKCIGEDNLLCPPQSSAMGVRG